MDPLAIFDRARSALSEINTSEILRERLALALDQGSVAEKRLGELQSQVSDLKAELKLARSEQMKKEEELATLRDALKEEVVIDSGIEFRRGSRTRGEWMPFCPKCHLPVRGSGIGGLLGCSDSDCGFCSTVVSASLPMIIGSLKMG